MSSSIKWSDKGATISTVNAVKEFPVLDMERVQEAINDGTLESRQGNFMGKQYTKLLRHQVKKLAKEVKKADAGSDAESEGASGDESENETRQPKWTDKGATISDKNAIKEFEGLTMEMIEKALEDGKLETRDGMFMGKSYRKLLRHQVEELAKEEGCDKKDPKKRTREIDDELEKLEEKKKKLVKEKEDLKTESD